MHAKIKILHVEDLDTDAELVNRELKKANFDFERLWVSNKEQYKNALVEFKPDVILCDHSLPSFTSVDALKILKELGQRIPFILVTATVSEEFVVTMMQEGIDDYILKDRLQRLPSALLNAIDKVSAENDKERYYKEIVTQEKRFRALIENLSEAIVLINENWQIIYQSPSATKITGYATNEVLHKNIFSFFRKSDAAEAEKLFKQAFSIPQVPIHASYQMISKAGKHIWMEGTITNLLNDESVKAFILNYRDVSERKISEKLLQKSEANLKTIYNNTSVSYILLDKKFKVLSFNDVTQHVFKGQFEKKIAEGHDFISLLHNKSREHFDKELQKVLTEKKVDFETSFQNPDAGLTWLCISILQVSSEGQVLGFIISAENITSRKNTELEREKMTADIIQHNKNLEQFAYIISHNLRSPVANIIGLSNMIHNTPDMSKEDFMRCMDGLELSVKKLDDTIIDLNYILQVRREVNEQKETVKFSSLVKDIKTSINNLIVKENINIITRFEEVNEFFTIKSYLNSIFYNLISNAIKYRHPQRRAVIEISSKLENDKLFLSFKDNGMGIDLEAHKEKIFGLYKKFHPQIEGKGMGLYLVKTQVEILGGTIDVHSVVDKGSEFIIEFEI